MKKIMIILVMILMFFNNTAYAYDIEKPEVLPTIKKTIYIRISYYNPKLCGNNDKWEINCDSNPEHLALVPNFSDDLYYKNVVACPKEWLGYVYTTVITIEGKEYWCLDTGSAIKLTHGTIYTQNGWEKELCYIPIDFLLLEQPSNYLWVYENWSTEWRLLSEFFNL